MTMTAIQIFKDYPEQKYNPLVPVQTITQISPLHRPSINIVQISTDEKDKDAYKEKNGEYALTKKGLMKLMAAANIEIVDSRSVIPSSCKRCLEMARATGKPSPCGECRCKDDVAWQVTIAVPDLTGGLRRVTATREFLCADEREKSASEKQFKGAYAFRSAMTESKALNRALREALMIRSTYVRQDLEKPFAVPVISINMDDPDMKRAVIERYARGESMLFGRPAQDSFAIEAGEVVDIPADEVEDFGDEEIAASFEPDEIFCQSCGASLSPFKNNKTGEAWTVERLAQYGVEHFGAPLCARCLQEKRRTTA